MEHAARKAGEVGLGFFNRDPQIWSKDNDSPVTEADLAIDKMLHQELLAAHPDYGWLSEETEDSTERLDKDLVFVVDPIDGTRVFINGGDEWTISIAIVKGDRPVVAVLYAPVRDEMYLASEGQPTTLNGKNVTVGSKDKLFDMRAVGPGPVIRKGALYDKGAKWGGYIGSLAYRIAMLADAKADLALARGGAHDWDLAAADLIIAQAGGLLREEDGSLLRYNKKIPRHGALYATNPQLESLIQPLMSSFHFPARKSQPSA